MGPSVHDLSRGVIHKVSGNLRVEPNFCDYAEAVAGFSWDAARRELLDGLPAGGLNIAHEAVDRHAAGSRAQDVAIRWLGRDGSVRDVSFLDLARLSSQFANVLAGLHVRPGDAVFVLTGRIPELYVAALGTLKCRAVFAPLSGTLTADALRARLALGAGKVLITTPDVYAAKIERIRDSLPTLEHVLLTGEGRIPARTRALQRLMDIADHQFTIGATDEREPALLHFDDRPDGLTGVLHSHRVVLAHHAAGRMVLDLHDEEVCWCTAEPGRICATAYGIISPLSCGITSIVDEAAMDAERWYRILDEQCVSVWCTEAHSVRALMRAGAPPMRGRECDHLRLAIATGAGLGAEAVYWGVDTLGLPFHEDWAQTETGGIAVANFACTDIMPGSAGRPVPGFDAALVRRTAADSVRIVARPGQEGELALRADNPALFGAYARDGSRYRARFAGGWYLSGDRARRDEEGYLWFTGDGEARTR